MNWPHEAPTTTLAEVQAMVTTPDVAPRTLPDRSWPDGDHKVNIIEARRLIARRQRAVQISGFAVKKEPLLRLLNQTGCVGVRAYQAMEADGRPTLVMVGVDEHGEELLDGVLLEHMMPCPPFCPRGASLGPSWK